MTLSKKVAKIRQQIDSCKKKQVDNYSKIRKLQKENKELADTILMLKQKRRQMIFGSIEK